MTKRVLITGASGFVGANLARHMLTNGHEVHLLLRANYRAWRLQEIVNHVHLHMANLENRKMIRRAVSAINPEWVFHLAAYGAYSTQKDPEQMVNTNLVGCISLLDACVDAGVKSFINCGSSSEYGLKDHATTEQDILEPNSQYAVTKAAATHYGQYVARTRNFNAVTARLYSIYGPYEEPSRLIPTLIVHGIRGKLPPLVGPRTARDFVYVDDAVKALVLMASAESLPRGSVYNVCTGIQTRLSEVVEVARRYMNIPAEPTWGTMQQRSWDSDIWVGSPHKIQSQIGWQANTTLEDGLQQTIGWLQRNPVWSRFYNERVLPENTNH